SAGAADPDAGAAPCRRRGFRSDRAAGQEVAAPDRARRGPQHRRWRRAEQQPALKKWTAKAKQFAESAVTGGLRWGAKVRQVDPVHFDLQVDTASPLWQAKYVLNQAMVALKHPIAAA